MGQTFDITLQGTPTAGYRWEVTIPPEDEHVVSLAGSSWSPAASHLGGAAEQRFHFQALAAGTAVVHFRYRRPWDTVAHDEREVTIAVTDT